MESMYLSCTTCALRGRGRDEIEETFRYAAGAGYKHWGLGGPFTTNPGLIQWLDVARLKQRMAAAGLQSLTEVWSPPISTESTEAARQGAENVASIARFGLAMGCSRVVQTGGLRREDGLRQTIAGLEHLLDLTNEMPILIALEPHMRSQILYPADYEAIFDSLKSEKLGITVDVGHFHGAGVDWKALIRRYPQRIYNIHLKDHVSTQSVAIGKGEIDLPGLITVLREIDYHGPLALELEVKDPENLPRYVKEAYEYMSGLLA